jgi:hypothetical protein
VTIDAFFIDAGTSLIGDPADKLRSAFDNDWLELLLSRRSALSRLQQISRSAEHTVRDSARVDRVAAVAQRGLDGFDLGRIDIRAARRAQSGHRRKNHCRALAIRVVARCYRADGVFRIAVARPALRVALPDGARSAAGFDLHDVFPSLLFALTVEGLKSKPPRGVRDRARI